MAQSTHHSVLIAGGGAAGITVAAYLAQAPHAPRITLIEPSSVHYYQPLWTLVGGGVFPREASLHDEADLIPAGVDWLQDSVTAFDPANNALTLQSGARLTYDYLVVAMGIQLDWDKVDGLRAALGHGGVCSNYSFETVASTWDALRGFRGGAAVFTQPSTPIKCGGAPQKIAYLADDHLRRSGVREKSTVHFLSGTATIFAVKKYADALTRVIARKGMQASFKRELIALRADQQQAIFKVMETGAEEVVPYDLLHVTPPMSAPAVIKSSSLASSAGWVDVDKHTLRHNTYANVFALGDCSSLPTSKTGAAIRKQAPAVAENVLAAMERHPLTGHYDGYTSCPLVTGYGKLILAEFDYDLQPQETFPFDQSQERYSMYALKAYGLPALYWNGMLRGRV